MTFHAQKPAGGKVLLYRPRFKHRHFFKSIYDLFFVVHFFRDKFLFLSDDADK